MRNRTIALPIAGLSFFTMSCQPGDTRSPGAFSVTDSAGIQIVESAAPAWGEGGWTVSDSPSVVIGRREGDDRYLFGEVGGALMLRDGRIAVLDMQAALIRVYSAEGEHIEDWGGQGEGPGEFSFPASIFPYRGDSVLVSEFVASSFTIFDDQGRFGRRMIPEIQQSFYTEWRRRMEEGDRSVTPAESCCRLWGPLATGAFLLSHPEMIPQTGTGTKRATVTAAINPDSGGVAENVGEFAGGAYQLGLQDRPLGFQFQTWFNMTAGPDGYFATEGYSYSIDEYDDGGDLRRIIRLTRELRPVTDEVKAAYEAEMRDLIMAPGTPIEGGSPEEVLEMMLAGPYPSHLPTFSRLHVDQGGNLWAHHYPYGVNDDTNEYFVFSADGRHLGMVELQAGLWVYQIGTDFVLGRMTGDLDVNYVHLYAIGK
ncbi:MAG: hypothetical protein OXL34_10520 [Gemmatimonadota bacterium]|nr:hypothetical protein [Gemmatimonadota bacterium]